MKETARLLAGFRGFRATYFEQRPQLFETLSRAGQAPKAMVVACSDSRVDPAILFNAEPGELFVIRNVANLVPPYEPDHRHHGTSAALEFGVRDLKVRDLVVLGHSGCGGIHALCEAHRGRPVDREFITAWIAIAAEACGDRPEVEERDVERAAIRRSLANLRTFPWIAAREAEGKLTLHGWWFDMENGVLWALDHASDEFRALEPADR